jgi:hypothetical protein
MNGRLIGYNNRATVKGTVEGPQPFR